MARDNYSVPELIYAPAKRGASNLLIALCGTWGTGKTRSALEIAVGLADGGLICVADTEHGRSLAYAERFNFKHLPLTEPFRPELFEAAAVVAQKAGAKVWICDNFSWEHIGPGGLLQWHEAELTRMAGDNYTRREQLKMTAWIAPKAAHGAMLQRFWQLNCHIILCIQAKKKIAIVKNDKGKMEPKDVGWQPNCGEDVPYAMTTAIMLHPGKPGIPTIIKPNEFLDPYIPLDRPLNADVGRAFAAWARGETPPMPERIANPNPVGEAPIYDMSNEYSDEPPGYITGPDDGLAGSPPDDEPPPVDPKMVAYVEALEERFMGTKDRAEHLKIVDDKEIRDRLAWLKKNQKALHDKHLKPAIAASWARTDPLKQEPAKDEAKVTEELPL
jgi:hypothetical protein